MLLLWAYVIYKIIVILTANIRIELGNQIDPKQFMKLVSLKHYLSSNY